MQRQVTLSPPPARNGHSQSLQVVQNGSVGSSASVVTNTVRLRLVMGLFRLQQKDICRATGFSKSYVSQVLADGGFPASERFWLRLNSACLNGLLRDGASNVFDVPPMSAQAFIGWVTGNGHLITVA